MPKKKLTKSTKAKTTKKSNKSQDVGGTDILIYSLACILVGTAIIFVAFA